MQGCHDLSTQLRLVLGRFLPTLYLCQGKLRCLCISGRFDVLLAHTDVEWSFIWLPRLYGRECNQTFVIAIIYI